MNQTGTHKKIIYTPGQRLGAVIYVRPDGEHQDVVRWPCCGLEETVKRRPRLQNLKHSRAHTCPYCKGITAPEAGELMAMIYHMPVSAGLRRDLWGNPCEA
jgi:hypothetical protein